MKFRFCCHFCNKISDLSYCKNCKKIVCKKCKSFSFIKDKLKCIKCIKN